MTESADNARTKIISRLAELGVNPENIHITEVDSQKKLRETLGNLGLDTEEAQEIENMVVDFAKSPQGEAIGRTMAFTEMTHSVFNAILLCVCVSHNRSSEVGEIHDKIVEKVGRFVERQSHRVAADFQVADKVLFEVMLRTRALAEDALGVPRHDGTEAGS